MKHKSKGKEVVCTENLAGNGRLDQIKAEWKEV
jgi:hypothetical protein